MPDPLPRPSWPNGARLAVALTFDNFGESLDLLRYGHAGGALADGVYAPRRGVGRVLDVLARHGVPATFFVEGWNARKYTTLAREVAAAGHEVGAHGWMHETWDRLDLKTERDLVTRTTGALGDAIGRPPRGWRAPGGLTTTATLGLVKDAGYLYDSSFADDDIPYHLDIAHDRPTKSILELPWGWFLDDAVYFAHGGGRISSSADVHALWREELEAALATTGYFMLVCHPRFIGRPARAAMLDRLIADIRALGSVWFATCEQLARHALASPATPRHPAPEVAATE